MSEGALTFVLPAGSEAISGGNIFNRKLIGALREIVPVVTIGFEEYRLVTQRGTPGFYFADTLDLREFVEAPRRKQEQFSVLIVHHLPSLEPGLDPGDESLAVEKAALPLFDALLTTSPFTTDVLISRGFAPERIVTVIPGLSPIERHPRSYQPPLRALVVGNLIPRKAVLEFLRVLEPVLEDEDRLVLEIVGRTDLDPEYGRSCLEFIAASPRLRKVVRVSGPVAHEDMGEIYQRAALLVSAARMETFGMALQEAREYGLPILAFEAGHAGHHVTDGENGFLFASIDGLAARLGELARDEPMMRALFDRAQRLPRAASSWGNAAETLVTYLVRRFGFPRSPGS
jgi:glycosyltransferase involved in cell wall biosynthesis